MSAHHDLATRWASIILEHVEYHDSDTGELWCLCGLVISPDGVLPAYVDFAEHIADELLRDAHVTEHPLGDGLIEYTIYTGPLDDPHWDAPLPNDESDLS